MPRLRKKTELCVGCDLCSMACSAHHSRSFNASDACILIDEAFPSPGAYKVRYCTQCVTHECVTACSFDAFRLNEQLNVWVIDRALCVGCGACVTACPHDGVYMEPNGRYALKCDLCGGEPACIEVCPKEVLSLTK